MIARILPSSPSGLNYYIWKDLTHNGALSEGQHLDLCLPLEQDTCLIIRRITQHYIPRLNAIIPFIHLHFHQQPFESPRHEEEALIAWAQSLEGHGWSSGDNPWEASKPE